MTFPVLDGSHAVFVFQGQEPSFSISNNPLGLLDLHLPGMLEGNNIRKFPMLVKAYPHHEFFLPGAESLH